jgi:hypothetical protein
MPHTTVPVHHAGTALSGPRVTEMRQQAVAFPALIALTSADPLAAAIDAIYTTALAHGDDRDRFLTEAHTALE